MNKTEAQKAYDAGHRLGQGGVQWPDSVPEELRSPSVRHCPFDLGDPQRGAWLKGLKAALRVPREDPADIIKQIDEELAR
jgi:hypothetical protein